MAKCQPRVDALGFYQSHSAGYDRSGHQQFYQAIARRLLDQVPPEPQVASILEVGAGTGFATAVIAAAYPEAKIVALEPSEAMISRAKNRVRGVEWACCPVTELHSGRFDLVLASMSYHWLNRDERDRVDALTGAGRLAIAMPTTSAFIDLNGNRALRETVLQLRPNVGWPAEVRQTNRVIGSLRRRFSRVALHSSTIRETYNDPGEFGHSLQERGILFALFADGREEAQKLLNFRLVHDKRVDFDWSFSFITADSAGS